MPNTHYVLTRRVAFSETDMAGVMHFSNFLRWQEDAEHAFFRSLGLSIECELGGRRISWPRVSVGCQFAGPARFADEVEIHLRLARIGRKSVNFEAEFRPALRQAQGRESSRTAGAAAAQPIAVGRSTSVCCVVQAGPPAEFEAIDIPEEIRRKLQAAAGE